MPQATQLDVRIATRTRHRDIAVADITCRLVAEARGISVTAAMALVSLGWVVRGERRTHLHHTGPPLCTCVCFWLPCFGLGAPRSEVSLQSEHRARLAWVNADLAPTPQPGPVARQLLELRAEQRNQSFPPLAAPLGFLFASLSHEVRCGLNQIRARQPASFGWEILSGADGITGYGDLEEEEGLLLPRRARSLLARFSVLLVVQHPGQPRLWRWGEI